MNKAASAQTNPEQSQSRSGSAAAYANMRDPFRLFDEKGAASRPQPRKRKLKALESKAFETMGIPANAPAEEIKTRYKTWLNRTIRMPMVATAALRNAFVK